MKNKKELVTFVVILLVLSTSCYLPIVQTHSIKAGNGLCSSLLMWCPGASAILTRLICAEPRKEFLKTLGLLPGKPIFWLVAYLLPILYGLVAYSFIWISGIGGFPDDKFFVWALSTFPKLSSNVAAAALILQLMTIDFVMNLHRGLGEELGWRGFLVPRLMDSWSFVKTSTVIGLGWGLWHFPAILLTNYNLGAPYWVALPCFIVLTISISFILTWLRMKSKSVWPCAILHISHNMAIQGIFTPLTKMKEHTVYFIDEFGIVLATVSAITAFIIWKKYSKQTSTC